MAAERRSVRSGDSACHAGYFLSSAGRNPRIPRVLPKKNQTLNPTKPFLRVARYLTSSHRASQSLWVGTAVTTWRPAKVGVLRAVAAHLAAIRTAGAYREALA